MTRCGREGAAYFYGHDPALARQELEEAGKHRETAVGVLYFLGRLANQEVDSPRPCKSSADRMNGNFDEESGMQKAKLLVRDTIKGNSGVILLFFCTSLFGAGGQQLRFEDVPPTGLTPESYRNAPLDATQRATVEEAVKSRQYTRAETLLVLAIDRNPKSPALLTLVGRIFFLDGKYLNCAIALKKAEALAPLDDRDRFTLALAYIILNHRDWARPELETLARSDPRNGLYPYWLGRLDYDAMQFKAAVGNFQKALNLDPTFMKAYDNLGLSYEALGQFDDAIRIYQEAIRLNRQQQLPSPWPPLNLGTVLVRLGKLGEAETYLKESLRYDPRFPKAHYQMGLLLEKQKKDDEAIRELNQAAALDPTYPEPHYVLGRIYRRTGDPAKAEAAWATFQKLKREKKDERPH